MLANQELSSSVTFSLHEVSQCFCLKGILGPWQLPCQGVLPVPSRYILCDLLGLWRANAIQRQGKGVHLEIGNKDFYYRMVCWHVFLFPRPGWPSSSSAPSSRYKPALGSRWISRLWHLRTKPLGIFSQTRPEYQFITELGQFHLVLGFSLHKSQINRKVDLTFATACPC